MRSLSYIFHVLFYKPILKVYLKKDSNITFRGFKLKVLRGVFHPKLFFSTKYFYSFLEKQNFEKLRFLEIGCGSGILSLLAYQKGAYVTAIDIDPRAVENTKLNFSKNFTDTSGVKIIHSDVFTNVPLQQFDMVVINPPYYFKKVENADHNAWYCGLNGEFFESLFSKLTGYIHPTSSVYMILEENCEIDRIQSIARRNKLGFEIADEKLIQWERSFIFKISLTTS